MKMRRDRTGYSIVELLVTLAVSGALVALLARGYMVQKSSAESEAVLRDLNLKSQLAMERIRNLIRNAGLGAEESLASGDALENANPDFTEVFTLASRSDGPDALTVVTGYPPIGWVQCNTDTPTCTTECTVASGICRDSNQVYMTLRDPDRTLSEEFDTAHKRYVFIAPSGTNAWRLLQTTPDDKLTLDQALTVQNRDPVYRVAARTIALDLNAAPGLYLYDNLADLANEEEYKLVEGVEDLQFQFLLKDANGATDFSAWHDTLSTGQIDDVRAVRIWLLLRSDRPDPRYEDVHEANGTPKAYVVADHLIQLDTNDENGFESVFDHRYHRLLTVETVMVRNRNL